MMWFYAVITLISVGLSGCSRDKPRQAWGMPMFSEVPVSLSGILFDNPIIENEELNGVTFSYAYNGAGVCAADFNNDGLPDLVFCGNQTGPVVYENLGQFRFKKHLIDVPADNRHPGWYTGISYADINNDGKFDLYVCRSGIDSTVRHNLLFINMGEFKFKECAAAYKLDDARPSTQGIFFDFDKDGDEDCLLINHPSDFTHILNPYAFSDSNLMRDGTDQLFLNNGESFINVTEQYGLSDSRGFGLSAQIADFNQDGWPDIWVANDYISNDQIWLNEEGKGFRDATREMIRSSSLFSMGTDHGDLNNDGFIDLAVADMKPDNHYRIKNNLISLPLDYYTMLDKHFQPAQRIKNSIYLGNQNNRYTECAQALGLDKTDWSWSMIMEDLDLDGLQDLLVTNGTLRDLHDLDFIMLQESSEQKRDYSHKTNAIYKNMPVSPLKPYVFRNKGHLKFENETRKWGLDYRSISSGAAISDLDADGDWDLIISRSGTTAGIYRNNTKNKGIRITSTSQYKLSTNPSPAYLHTGNRTCTYFPHSIRGYASQSENILIIPKNRIKQSDSIEFVSGTGRRIVLHAADYPQKTDWKIPENSPQTSIKQLSCNPQSFGYSPETLIPADDIHIQEPSMSIFKIHRLIPEDPFLFHPKISVRDYRHQKLIAYSHPEGIRILAESPGKAFENLLLKFPKFNRVITDFQWIKMPGFKNPILAVASASYITDTINPGIKFWELTNENKLRQLTLPFLALPGNVRCLAVGDFNMDGNEDVFAGGACTPWNYPAADKSCLIQSISGTLSSKQIKIPDNLAVDAACYYQGSSAKMPSLYIALRYGGIYRAEGNDLNILHELSPNLHGRWNKLICCESKDQKNPMVVACGEGSNGYPSASLEKPIKILRGDFDNNHITEPLLLHSLQSQYGLFADRNTLCEQMPLMRNYFHTYKSYASGNPLKHIDTSRSEATYLLNTTASGLLKADKSGKYRWIPLEPEVSLDAWSDAVLLNELNGLLMGISSVRNGIPSSPLGAEHLWEFVNIGGRIPTKEMNPPKLNPLKSLAPGRIGISKYGNNTYLLTDGIGGLYRFSYP